MTTPDAPLLCPRLAIERREDAQSVILVLRGEIDLASAPELERATLEALSTGQQRIVIDLAGVDFLDSTGLRTLIVAHERAASKGHSVVLRHVRPQARRLFELTGTAGAFLTG